MGSPCASLRYRCAPAWRDCWLGSRTLAAWLALAFAATAHATDFTVSSSADDGSAGTLRWAIEQANAAGAGSHTISFSVATNSVIQLTDDLPQLDNANGTIDFDASGAGKITIDGHNAHRVLFVNSGTWQFRNLNIVNGFAQGGSGGYGGSAGGGGGLGAGGTLFVNENAHVSIQNVSFQGNQATGGNGGIGHSFTNLSGSGGGGLGGNGGNAYDYGGGGGGGTGRFAIGGDGGSSSGGGGGGLILPGNPGIGPIGGVGAPLGGNGGDIHSPGQPGLPYGGGGGAGDSDQNNDGGDGGTFGGGGGSGGTNFTAVGGNGGFGAGGGGGQGNGGYAGFGGGNGGQNEGGHGGSGLGGAVFVRQGGTLTVIGSTTSDNGVAYGTGATNGLAQGQDLYLMSGVNANFRGTNTYENSISGDGSIRVQNGTTHLWGVNTYTAGTQVDAGATLKGNSDSLQGQIANNGNVEFTQDFNGNYSGAITGNGDFLKTGAGVLTLTNASNAQAQITIDGGALVGTTNTINAPTIRNDSLLAYDQSFNGTVATAITGNGDLVKLGTGTLELAGAQLYTGRTDILEGHLVVNGSLASETWVGDDGTLGGNGTILGNLHNFGHVGAGNSIGTMTVGEDYTHAAGATLDVEINDGGTTPGVNNDLINVAGSATLQGGTVDIQANAGSYTVGTTYRFLSATSISGHFNDATFTGLPANLRAILGYGEFAGLDWAYFTIFDSQTNFVLVAETFNEWQVANYVDSVSSTSTGLLNDVIDEMLPMSPAAQRNALNQLTAVANPSLAQLNVLDTTFMYMMLRRRVGSSFAAGGMIQSGDDYAANDAGEGRILPVRYTGGSCRGDAKSCGPCWSGWMSGYGFGGNAQSDGNAAGGVYGSGGSIVAIERAVDSSTLVGLFGAYSHLGLSLNSLPQNASADQGLVGAYGLRRFENSNYLLGAASAGFTGYRETRHINIGNVNATAQGDYGGWNPTTYLELGRSLQWGRTSVQPYVAGQYLYVRQNKFTETGADNLDQQINGVDTHALRGFLGARAAQTWRDASGRVWIPELRAVWMHEFLNPDTTLSAVFAPVGGSSFQTRGLDFGRDWAVLGGGTQYVLTRNLSLTANYDLLVNSQQVWNAGSGGVQFAW